MNAQIFYLDWNLANEDKFYKPVNDIICGLASPTVDEVTSSNMYNKVGEVDLGPNMVFERIDEDLIPMETLESIYMGLQNGIGKGTEQTLGTPRRSMSVGDVVKVWNGWYVVAGCGFKAVA